MYNISTAFLTICCSASSAQTSNILNKSGSIEVRIKLNLGASLSLAHWHLYIPKVHRYACPYRLAMRCMPYTRNEGSHKLIGSSGWSAASESETPSHTIAARRQASSTRKRRPGAPPCNQHVTNNLSAIYWSWKSRFSRTGSFNITGVHQP